MYMCRLIYPNLYQGSLLFMCASRILLLTKTLRSAELDSIYTAQKMKNSIKDFFSKWKT